MPTKAQTIILRCRRVAAWLAVVLTCMQAVGFVSFIWEEALQAAGFACFGAINARACEAATLAVDQFAVLRQSASTWEHRVGWLCPWMHNAYRSYFDRAAAAQLETYKAQLAKHCGGDTPAAMPTVATHRAVAMPMPESTEEVGPWPTRMVGTNIQQSFWVSWRTNKAALKEQGWRVSKEGKTWVVSRE